MITSALKLIAYDAMRPRLFPEVYASFDSFAPIRDFPACTECVRDL